ncbi:uncharacterized protein LOC113987343 [Pipra filicauda]|uniref:Uncharacterized protein LOC113987343 n=1 Tax=Pipra filicauda TaxID=649802 RepID=A0A7R5KE70_9PASS|nr:uncharacterized protein LOC113987343 [Pipra filicauda]
MLKDKIPRTITPGVLKPSPPVRGRCQTYTGLFQRLGTVRPLAHEKPQGCAATPPRTADGNTHSDPVPAAEPGLAPPLPSFALPRPAALPCRPGPRPPAPAAPRSGPAASSLRTSCPPSAHSGRTLTRVALSAAISAGFRRLRRGGAREAGAVPRGPPAEPGEAGPGPDRPADGENGHCSVLRPARLGGEEGASGPPAPTRAGSVFHFLRPKGRRPQARPLCCLCAESRGLAPSTYIIHLVVEIKEWKFQKKEGKNAWSQDKEMKSNLNFLWCSRVWRACGVMQQASSWTSQEVGTPEAGKRLGSGQVCWANVHVLGHPRSLVHVPALVIFCLCQHKRRRGCGCLCSVLELRVGLCGGAVVGALSLALRVAESASPVCVSRTCAQLHDWLGLHMGRWQPCPPAWAGTLHPRLQHPWAPAAGQEGSWSCKK